MRLSACVRLTLSPLTGTWYRAIANEYYEKTRLSTKHTRTISSRFSAGTPENPLHQILYLTANPQTALFEVGAQFGSPQAPVPNPHGVWTTLPLNVRLQFVADLTLPIEQKRIRTSAQELTGDWERTDHTNPVPTQSLGAALFQVPRLEAFLTHSAKVASTNLVVFPEKLQPGSRIEFHNPRTRKVERLKP